MLVASHRDADGICSVAQLLFALDEETKVIFPESFGDCSENPDIMVDMVPDDKNFSGTVFDHHPQHPSNPKYKLIFDNKPASLIIYDKYKDIIPKEKSWYAIAGTVGDGQPELVPLELWEKNPELLETQNTISKWSGEIKIYSYPIYSLLSSPINSLARIGKADKALKLIQSVKSPLEILNNKDILKTKQEVRTEHDRVLKKYKGESLGKLFLFVFESDVHLTGWIAIELSEITKQTVIVINSRLNSLSVRGTFAIPISKILSAKGIKIGGHPGFVGGEIKEEEIEILKTTLRNSIFG